MTLRKLPSRPVLVSGLVLMLAVLAFSIYLVILAGRPTVVVKYVVTGSSPAARIAYKNANGAANSHELNLPFEQVMILKRGMLASVIAYPLDLSGTVQCKILVNGFPLVSASATNQPAICEMLVR